MKGKNTVVNDNITKIVRNNNLALPRGWKLIGLQMRV